MPDAHDAHHPTAPQSYLATTEGLAVVDTTPKGTIHRLICNFVVVLLLSRVVHDLNEIRREVIFTVTLNGRTTTHTLAWTAFCDPRRWIPRLLGPAAVMHPISGGGQHLVNAVQTLSAPIPEVEIHECVGWDDLGVRHIHADGALGAVGVDDTVQVATPQALAAYAMTTPPTAESRGPVTRASLQILEVAPPRVTAAILQGTWAAAVGITTGGVALVGEPACADLAALAQQAYGPGLVASELPRWGALSPRLVAAVGSLRDVILAVRDYTPRDPRELRAMESALAGMIVAPGDRGSLLFVAGDTPPAGPGAGGLLTIKIPAELIDPAALATCRRAAADGDYAAATAGFIVWIAANRPRVAALLRDEVPRQRLALTGPADAAPLEVAANLAVAREIWLAYAVDTKILDPDEADALRERLAAGLAEAVSAHAKRRPRNPAEQIVALLGGALRAGRGNVALIDGRPPTQPGPLGWVPAAAAGRDGRQAWRAQGQRIGWLSGPQVLLDADAAYATVAAQARATGDWPPVASARALKAALNLHGALAATDRKRGSLTYRRTVEGGQREVLILPRESLLSEDGGGPDGPGPAPTGAGGGDEAAAVPTATQDSGEAAPVVPSPRTTRRGSATVELFATTSRDATGASAGGDDAVAATPAAPLAATSVPAKPSHPVTGTRMTAGGAANAAGGAPPPSSTAGDRADRGGAPAGDPAAGAGPMSDRIGPIDTSPDTMAAARDTENGPIVGNVGSGESAAAGALADTPAATGPTPPPSSSRRPARADPRTERVPPRGQAMLPLATDDATNDR
jgi:hypothetical protein